MDMKPRTELPSNRQYQRAADALLAATKCLKEDSPDEAISICGEALRSDPAHVGAYLLRASCHLRTGNLDQAIADCTAVIQDDPNNDAAYGVRATAYLSKGDAEKAKADFAKWQGSPSDQG